MGRGGFTQAEIEVLRKNPNVLNVNEQCISYSPGFKLKFMEEYLNGKGPTEIFQEAGFDSKMLGSKRIERASARWKESYQSGTLGAYSAVLGEALSGEEFLEKKEVQRKSREKHTADRYHQQEDVIRKLRAENELLCQICQEQKEQNRRLTKSEICQIIEDLICQDGYDGCISRLCEKAGISVSTFYKYRNATDA